MAVRIELNNGDFFEGEPHESYEHVMIRILQSARDRLGYVPSLEEARNCPYMPKDQSIYVKEAGKRKRTKTSYSYLCKKLVSMEEARSSWRKATDEEKDQLLSQERKKIPKKAAIRKEVGGLHKTKAIDPEERARLLSIVVDMYHENGDRMPSARALGKNGLFRAAELWNIFGDYNRLCLAVKEAVDMSGDKGNAKGNAEERQTVEQQVLVSEIEDSSEKEVKEMNEDRMVEVKKVIVEFAKQNLRWPTENEVNELHRQGVLGWYSSAELYRLFGNKSTWAGQFFPEGLPEGFVLDNRCQNGSEKKCFEKNEKSRRLAKKSAPIVETAQTPKKNPQEVFLAVVERQMEMLSAGEITGVDIKMSMPGTEEKFEFSINVTH